MGRQQVAGFIFLFIGILGFADSFQLSWGSWAEPGPAPFPLAVSLLLIIAGIVKIVQDLKAGERGGRIEWRTMVRGFLTPLKILGTTLVFILVLERLGYLVATLLFMFVLFVWVCRYRVWIAMGLSVAIGAGSWFFFETILKVQLPEGLLRYL
ncbi:MAG: tripartite tricarboxylate transporter TctB family protein [Candidatus Latescibacterota bacterium]